MRRDFGASSSSVAPKRSSSISCRRLVWVPAAIEVFLSGERVATHRRSYEPRGAAITDPAYRPANHRDQIWPPERLIGWGAKYGPAVATVVERMLQRYMNPEQGYRACLRLMRTGTAEKYGSARTCRVPTPRTP
jgi:hypothetical protein